MKESKKASERLDKVLSHHGFGTRKDVKKLLHTGVVTINGTLCTTADAHVDPENDIITVDGEELELRHHLYLMMNKCSNVVCSAKDGLHSTVFDLLEGAYNHSFLGGDLHMVGRLDIDTEGLLILTTDGKLTHRLTSPKTHSNKTYLVHLRDSVSDADKDRYIKACLEGMDIGPEGNEEGFRSEPAQLEWLSTQGQYQSEGSRALPCPSAQCLLTIYEGKYHQVKRMFSALGNQVVFLKRISMGDLQLDPSLAAGQYRELTPEEVALL
jgi:16S rRNA pseudouridine516 synthase